MKIIFILLSFACQQASSIHLKQLNQQQEEGIGSDEFAQTETNTEMLGAMMGAMGGGGGGGGGAPEGPTQQTAPSINIIDNNRSMMTGPGGFPFGNEGMGMARPTMMMPIGRPLGMPMMPQ